MKKKTQRTILLSLAILLLIGVTAGASVYATKELNTPDTTTTTTVKHHVARNNNVTWDHASAQPQPAPQQVATTCTDHNIIGTGIGAVAGGVVGNRFGKGDGRTVATVGGALGGAYLGNQLIPTQNALCK